MKKVHHLKTDPAAFDAVADKTKTFEIRKDDRGFAVGHLLLLKRTKYSAADMAAGAPLVIERVWTACLVTHILRGPIYGLAEGWVVMSVQKVGPDEVAEYFAGVKP